MDEQKHTDEQKDEALNQPLMDWQVKQREFEQVKARAKALKLRTTCTICGAKSKLPCPCGTTQYCSVACQKVDWRDRGHREACKKIRGERAAEAARADAPASSPEEIFYGPAPRSHADEVRARIAAEHEAARARREANPEREPVSVRYGSRCPICLEEWDVNENTMLMICCCRSICLSCERKTSRDNQGFRQVAPCPLCRTPPPNSAAENLARLRRHVENDLAEAITFLANEYHYPDAELGLVKSDKKAVKLLKRAVELGDANAMFCLGEFYYSGSGVKQSNAKAKQLFKMAADIGHAHAQCKFGVALQLDGRNSQIEEGAHASHLINESNRYMTLSAEQGFTFAEYTLGTFYLSGQSGLGVDMEKALRFLHRAATKGDEGAIEVLAVVERRAREIQRNEQRTAR